MQLKEHHPEIYEGNVIALHLGNGSSLCSMKLGKSIDTTMGMTSLEGPPMGTRSGSIDPGVVLYMQQQMDMSADEVDECLFKHSGLQGLSGISNDVQIIREQSINGEHFSLELYTHEVAKHAARMAVSLGGVDALVFTGGIGENDALIREAIAKKLKFLGEFKLHSIAFNEEYMLAKHAKKLLVRH